MRLKINICLRDTEKHIVYYNVNVYVRKNTSASRNLLLICNWLHIYCNKQLVCLLPMFTSCIMYLLNISKLKFFLILVFIVLFVLFTKLRSLICDRWKLQYMLAKSRSHAWIVWKQLDANAPDKIVSFKWQQIFFN